jgi:hypothetical protein
MMFVGDEAADETTHGRGETVGGLGGDDSE